MVKSVQWQKLGHFKSDLFAVKRKVALLNEYNRIVICGALGDAQGLSHLGGVQVQLLPQPQPVQGVLQLNLFTGSVPGDLEGAVIGTMMSSPQHTGCHQILARL